jgi:hypothetical protein
VHRDPLGVGGRPDHVHGGQHDRRQVRRPRVEAELAGNDARDIQDVLDQARLDLRIALDGVGRLVHHRRRDFRVAQDVGPPEHRVERRPELV